jgi:hypothetical protein
MPRALNTEEKVARCVDHYDALLAGKDGSRVALSQCPMSHLHVLVGRAGRKKVSRSFLASLEEQFAHRQIRTFPPLSDPTLGRNTRIHFYRESDPITNLRQRRQLFPEERQLEVFVASNHLLIDYFAKDHLTFRGRQYPLDTGERLDLLFERTTAPRELVGVELKNKYPGDGIAGQAARYIDGLAKLGEKRGIANTRLVIITGQPDPIRERAVADIAHERGARVEWLLYRVSLDLEPTSLLAAPET